MTKLFIPSLPATPFLKLSAIPDLPPTVCFRVTRFCNARCGFCLAPPDGGIHPGAVLLKSRIDWLLDHGVKTIHFCGGEPTIHHDLPDLINHVSLKGGKSKMTTNGIALSDDLISVLHRCKTQVKVSLHGEKSHHNHILGCDAFNKTTEAIRRLLSKSVSVSVQTTIVKNHPEVVPWMIQFCIDHAVRRVSFLPFIPRGNGYERRTEYGLSPSERRELRNVVALKRRRHSGILEIRLLDFTARPIHVVEPDGNIVIEGATEAMDTLLFQIPVHTDDPVQLASCN